MPPAARARQEEEEADQEGEAGRGTTCEPVHMYGSAGTAGALGQHALPEENTHTKLCICTGVL